MTREITIAIIFALGAPILVGNFGRFFAFSILSSPKANGTLLASLFASFILILLSMGVTLGSPYQQSNALSFQVIAGALLFLIAIGFWIKSLQFAKKRWLLIESGVLLLLIFVAGIITYIEGNGEDYYYGEPLSDPS
ncbi:MAG: hypothetical protein COA53_08375 [Rhodobacteraceae bacterium]|nr:MAG: hypothetical protein COA53_08375 [Paracoccaceae bacterium]